MSAELATIETVTTQVDPTGGRLLAWAKAASAANSLAKSLVKTDFVPKKKEGNSSVAISEGDATAMILMGDELGFTPLAALKSIYVVHGTPALYTRSMVALVLSRGHEIWTEESKNDSVTVCGQRKGSSHVETSTWTIKRATDAGYTSNAKYRTNPQEMLYAKAAAEIARKIGADVLMGIPYSVEELELEESTTTTLTRENGSETTKLARKIREPKEKPVIPSPPLDGEEEELAGESESESASTAESAEVDVRPVSDSQIRKMGAQMRELGMSDREVALAYVNDVIGRTVATRNELTLSEASKVIESLDAEIRVHNAEQEVQG